jgi:hypothetical protein
MLSPVQAGQPAGQPHITIQGYGNKCYICPGHLISYMN